MKRGQFKIQLNHGYYITVSGYVNNYYGVHKTENGSWSVTQLKSGKFISFFKLLKNAKQLADKLDIYGNLSDDELFLKTLKFS